MSIEYWRRELRAQKRKQQAYYRLFRTAQTHFLEYERRVDSIYNRFPSSHPLHQIRRRSLLRNLRDEYAPPSELVDRIQDYHRLWLQTKNQVKAIGRRLVSLRMRS